MCDQLLPTGAGVHIAPSGEHGSPRAPQDEPRVDDAVDADDVAEPDDAGERAHAMNGAARSAKRKR